MHSLESYRGLVKMDKQLTFLFGGYSSNCGHYSFKKNNLPCVGVGCFAFVSGTSVHKSPKFHLFPH
jgi:hypothetical protein